MYIYIHIYIHIHIHIHIYIYTVYSVYIYTLFLQPCFRTYVPVTETIECQRDASPVSSVQLRTMRAGPHEWSVPYTAYPSCCKGAVTQRYILVLHIYTDVVYSYIVYMYVYMNMWMNTHVYVHFTVNIHVRKAIFYLVSTSYLHIYIYIYHIIHAVSYTSTSDMFVIYHIYIAHHTSGLKNWRWKNILVDTLYI